jgi:hypothetical protein
LGAWGTCKEYYCDKFIDGDRKKARCTLAGKCSGPLVEETHRDAKYYTCGLDVQKQNSHITFIREPRHMNPAIILSKR